METKPGLKVYAYVYDGQVLGLTYYPDNLPKGWKTYECPTIPYQGKQVDVKYPEQVIYDQDSDKVVLHPETPMEDQ